MLCLQANCVYLLFWRLTWQATSVQLNKHLSVCLSVQLFYCSVVQRYNSLDKKACAASTTSLLACQHQLANSLKLIILQQQTNPTTNFPHFYLLIYISKQQQCWSLKVTRVCLFVCLFKFKSKCKYQDKSNNKYKSKNKSKYTKRVFLVYFQLNTLENFCSKVQSNLSNK